LQKRERRRLTANYAADLFDTPSLKKKCTPADQKNKIEAKRNSRSKDPD